MGDSSVSGAIFESVLTFLPFVMYKGKEALFCRVFELNLEVVLSRQGLKVAGGDIRRGS